MMPTRIKSSGINVNSILAKTEATLAGFDEAIILNHDGHVCEGSAENVFVVAEGRLIIPPLVWTTLRSCPYQINGILFSMDHFLWLFSEQLPD